MPILIRRGGQYVRYNGKYATDIDLCDCCCGETPCCPDAPTGSLLVTVASECADVDGATFTLRKAELGWIYYFVDDGRHAVFQDLWVEVVCVETSLLPGAQAYRLKFLSGCLSKGYLFDVNAGAGSSCDPFTLQFDALHSGMLTTECFECVEPGGSFQYSLTITAA